MRSFYCGGHLGDGVYQLYTVMKAGGGKFLIGPGQSERWGPAEFQALYALAAHQSYVMQCEIVNEVWPSDFDFQVCARDRNPQDFYEWNDERWPGNINLKKRYFVGYFKDRGMRWVLNNFKRSERWLTAPCNKPVDVVFHAPLHRLCRPKTEWVSIIDELQRHGKRVAIIGGKDVKDWTNCAFTVHQPNDLLEAANWINSAKIFIGAASCNYVIAEGLGKLRFVDIPQESEGTRPADENGWDVSKWPTGLLLERLLQCLSRK